MFSILFIAISFGLTSAFILSVQTASIVSNEDDYNTTLPVYGGNSGDPMPIPAMMGTVVIIVFYVSFFQLIKNITSHSKVKVRKLSPRAILRVRERGAGCIA